ncbi:hypothetical protein I6B53_09420 [Schaalia sp. 19OD2882]|nr:hypothetical protein [Schaalia sp. 19OD2882]QWW19303.1 hypothetical protein I6B53_09420 [Schaalia sp. 19OD2882]
MRDLVLTPQVPRRETFAVGVRVWPGFSPPTLEQILVQLPGGRPADQQR